MKQRTKRQIVILALAILSLLSSPAGAAAKARSFSAPYTNGWYTRIFDYTAGSNPDSSDEDHYNTSTPPMQENFDKNAAQQMLEMINEERARYGLAPLQLSDALCHQAALKSQDFYNLNYFAHESPTYGRARDMLSAAGISFSACAENIAHHGSIEKAHAALMSSAGHRRNILGNYTHVGIGIVADRNGFPYITQIFTR